MLIVIRRTTDARLEGRRPVEADGSHATAGPAEPHHGALWHAVATATYSRGRLAAELAGHGRL